MAVPWNERLQLAQTLKIAGGGNRQHDPITGRFATYGSSAPSKRKKGGKVGRPLGSGGAKVSSGTVTARAQAVSRARPVSSATGRVPAMMAKLPLAKFVNVRDPARNDGIRAKLNTLGDGVIIDGWKKVVRGGQSYWQNGKQVLTNLPDSVLDRTAHKALIVKSIKDGVLPPMQAIAIHSKDYPQIANWPVVKNLIDAQVKEMGVSPNGVVSVLAQLRNTLYETLSYKAFSPKKNKLKKHLEAIDGKAMPVEQAKFSLQNKQPAAMVLAQNAGWTRLGGFENPKWINTREPDASKRAEVMDFLPAAVLISKIYKPQNTSVGKVKRKNVFGPQVIQNAHPLENTSPFYYNKRGPNYSMPKSKTTKKEVNDYIFEVTESVKSRKPRNYRKEYDNFHGTPKQIKMRGLRNSARRQSGLAVGDPREVDHIVPLSKGGSHRKSNLRIVSRHTNRSKMAKTTKEYISFVIHRCFKDFGLKI